MDIMIFFYGVFVLICLTFVLSVFANSETSKEYKERKVHEESNSTDISFIDRYIIASFISKLFK